MFGLKNNNFGFTILEVVVAMGIFAVAIIALGSLTGSIIKATELGKRRTQAIGVAVQKMESLKKIRYADIQNGSAVAITGIGTWACVGVQPFECTPTPNFEMLEAARYTWLWRVTYIDLDGDGFVFHPDLGAPFIRNNDIKRIDLDVTWTDIFGRHTVTLTKLRAV